MGRLLRPLPAHNAHAQDLQKQYRSARLAVLTFTRTRRQTRASGPATTTSSFRSCLIRTAPPTKPSTFRAFPSPSSSAPTAKLRIIGSESTTRLNGRSNRPVSRSPVQSAAADTLNHTPRHPSQSAAGPHEQIVVNARLSGQKKVAQAQAWGNDREPFPKPRRGRKNGWPESGKPCSSSWSAETASHAA